MTTDSRQRFAEVVRAERVDLGLACLLIGSEVTPDLDVDEGIEALDGLATQAADQVGGASTPEEVAAALGHALGTVAGFHGAGQDYGDLRASLLHEVLRRRRGLPILLSVVYLEVARRLDRPVLGIGLPGHFVVGVFGGPAPVLLDPFHHGRVTSAAELSVGVRAVTGVETELAADELRPWEDVDVLSRVLANIRGQSVTSDTLRTRLWAVELAMLLPRHPTALRRERGELLARLGDYVGAAAALEGYAAVVADTDPDASKQADRQARLVRSRLS